MRQKKGNRAGLGLVAGLVAVITGVGVGDEGMWLFNQPPRQQLREKHGFEASEAWLEHLQKASVRFSSGGSGSFVSEDGLVMSNHHVGADALHKLGDKDHDYLRDGFWAKSLAEEKPCLDLELNVLMSIEDVTERVEAAVKPGLSPEDAATARRAVMAALEKESLEQTGFKSEVVTLYQGGMYHLYRFKRYTDVRLVFAPEQQIAFFGGDPDNFEYPRFDLDICFLRAYENGRPAKPPHFLTWSPEGPGENELVLVSGHPGRTDRLLTVAELEYLRDHFFPYTLQWLHRREALLTAFGARSAENARRARDDLYGAQNSRKAREGGLAGLLDPKFFEQKRKAEQQFQSAVARDESLKGTTDAWRRIQEAENALARNLVRHRLLEGGHGFNCDLFGIARRLLRAAEERPKPDGERLREFREANRPSLELELFSTRPIYDDYEQLQLADALTWLAGHLGCADPLVQQVLAGQSPKERAAALVSGTSVKDVPTRRRLYAEGKAAVEASRDPMIELARSIDSDARAARKIAETQEEITRQAHAQLARARFALQGAGSYPDATFTLRLAFGVVKGYQEASRQVPFQTTFAGLYQRAEEQQYRPPFDLPARWVKSRNKLNLGTPLNFVCTADIIGGNSGSPVVNRRGELVGVIFDGNIQSLVLDFYFTEAQARALAVHARGILEALRKVYKAGRLADELCGRRRPA